MTPAPVETTLDELDFGFYYPLEYLTEHAWFLEHSNFVFGWPEPGGLDNQPADFVRDVMTWFDIKELAREEQRTDKHSGSDLFAGANEADIVRTKGWR